MSTRSLDSFVEPWPANMTVGEVLRRTAKEHGDRDAVVFPALGLRWTWTEFDRRVDAVAAGLIEIGVEKGEHVGIWSMNCPEWLVIQFAVGRIGSVLVNVNPAYRLHELEASLRQADVGTLVVGCPFKSSDFVGMVEEVCPESTGAAPGAIRSSRLPVLRRLVAIGAKPGVGWHVWSDLESCAPDERTAERENSAKASDVYNIQFTSGTTGLPKGAMLTHRNILMNAFYVGERLKYDARDRVCVPVPFYHCFGCVLGTTVCAVYGSTIVAPAPSFDAGATLAAIAAERCTSIYGVPTMFISQINHPDRGKYDLSSLRTGIMAGSPCPLPLMKEVVSILGAEQITIGYGLTEASPIITMTSVDDPIDVRVGTVGSPIPGAIVSLIDPITGNDVGDGVDGELCVVGHGVMAGYYKNPEATARVISPEGRLRSGDIARKLPDGNYKIVGRSKELIIRGGENIYPPEIEEFLIAHPSIAEAAIVGVPDEKYGEAVSAWIVPKAGAAITPEEIVCYCQGRIAHFKIPRYIEIVEQLPRTVTGKIQKFVLKEQGITRFGLESAAAIPTA